MSYKWIGAVFIIVSCGGVGFLYAAVHKREERLLRQLLNALDLMECELQYRLTPLPDLCRQASREGTGPVAAVFGAMAAEMDRQISPDAASCMHAALQHVSGLPDRTGSILQELGNTLGRFDLNGQLKGLEHTRSLCRRQLDDLSDHREERLRSYQTLGLCAGAALAILMI